jgi:hypothetical protein
MTSLWMSPDTVNLGTVNNGEKGCESQARGASGRGLLTEAKDALDATLISFAPAGQRYIPPETSIR